MNKKKIVDDFFENEKDYFEAYLYQTNDGGIKDIEKAETDALDIFSNYINQFLTDEQQREANRLFINFEIASGGPLNYWEYTYYMKGLKKKKKYYKEKIKKLKDKHNEL